jgi:NCS1 family nucleobase:cation symporter-1
VAPKYINENKGVILTGIIGILLMSWELLKKLGWLDTDVSIESLISNFLIAYSSLLGPIAGIMIVDYFLIKKQSYDVLALYQDDAGYPAWNKAGLIAFALPVFLTLVAIVSRQLSCEQIVEQSLQLACKQSVELGLQTDFGQIAVYTGWSYDYGWFTGSFLGGLIYYLVARGEIRSST